MKWNFKIIYLSKYGRKQKFAKEERTIVETGSENELFASKVRDNFLAFQPF